MKTNFKKTALRHNKLALTFYPPKMQTVNAREYVLFITDDNSSLC